MSNLYSAANQYATRPADERFDSIDALIADALQDKNLSAERTYNLKDLSIAPATNGVQLVSPKGSATLSHWAFGQLARTLDAPAGFLRDSLSPQLTADVMNYRISQSPVGQSLNLYVRGQNGVPPIVRAATSESYARVHDAELYSATRDLITRHDDRWQLPPVWGGGVAGAYRGDRDSFLIMTNGGSIVTDPSTMNGRGDNAGAMYRGLMIRNSEVGAASISIESILFRYICGNHIIWGATIDRAFRRRHVGSKVLRDTINEIGTIARRWINHSASQDEAIIRRLIDLEIATTRDGVIDELRAMGASKDQATAAYDTCERTEAASPRSFWGVAQGLTRESQLSGFQDERLILDRLAGLVLARGAKVAA